MPLDQITQPLVELLETMSCFEKWSSMEVGWLFAKETKRISVV